MKQPQGKSILVYILVGVASSCLLFCGFGVFMTYRNLELGVRAMAPIIACNTEATALRDSLLAYAQRNGGKLPTAASWKDDVRDEFIRRRQELRQLDVALRSLPKDVPIQWSEPNGVWGCKYEKLSMQAFAYNSDLAGQEVKAIKEPQRQVLVFETPELENKAISYRPRKDRSEPRVMSELRDWIVVPVSGTMKNVTGVGQGSPASR